MIRFLPLLLCICLGICSMPGAQATHVMGGDLTYRHLHDSTYELTFLVYRDCNAGQANIDPSIVYFVYFKKSKNVFINNRRVPLYNNQKDKVKPEAPNCVNPSGVCIESGKYIDTVELGGDPDGYIVTWYRLERNHAINNLKRCVSSTNNSSCTSGSCNGRNPFGMVWTAEVPSFKYKNSSPQFLTVPVPYFCVGISNSFNHVVFDPDGDSLVFKIVTPLSPDQCLPAAPNPSNSVPAPSYNDVYETVVYQSGYSSTLPFGSSSSAISINSTTGEMKANPSSSGNYVIAIKIEEYRVDPVTKKTTYLGSIRRDLQFIAGNCPNVSNAPPFFNSPTTTTYKVDPFDTLTFKIEAEDKTDSVFIRSNGSIFGGSGSTIPTPHATLPNAFGVKKATSTFFWVPTCEHITYTSPHIFTVTLSDEGCNQVQRTFSVYVQGRDIYTPPDILCVNPVSGGEIQITWDTLRNVAFFKGLHLYRVNPDGTRAKIKSFTDSTITSFTDKSVSNATTAQYRYYLKIENSCGLEGFASDSLSTIVLTYKEISDKTLRFDWNSYGNGPFKYVLQKKENNAFVDVGTTKGLFIDYSSCVLNTDFRIKVIDTTTTQAYCSILSSVVTSTTVDNSPPVGAPGLKNVRVLDWGRSEITFAKSASTEVSQYGIYRALKGGAFTLISTLKSTANLNTYIDNGLANNAKEYCYRIVAQDSCGNAGDTSVQHCPVNLKAYGSQREVKLRWNKYLGYSIDSQYVERFDTISGTWKTWARLGPNDSTHIDKKATLCGFIYDYRLRTLSAASAGSYQSWSDSVLARAKDTIAPAAIDILWASNVDDTTTKVVFKKSPATDVNDYLIIALEYKDGTLQNTEVTTYSTAAADTVKVDIKTKNTDTRSYCFGVIAVDSCGQNFSPNAELYCPVFVQATALNLGNRLNWSFYEGFQVDSYYVDVQDVNGLWSPIQQFSRTTKTVTYLNLPCKQPYTYRIRTKERTTGIMVMSNVITATPFDTIKPKNPRVRFTTVDNDTTIRLEWEQSTSGDVVSYDLLYGVNGSTLSLLGNLPKGPGSTQTYSHTGISAKTDTFTYRLVAIDSCSSTNRSVNNILQGAVQLSGVGANQENRLYWSGYKGFTVKEYQLEAILPSQTAFTTLQVLPSTASTYIHQNLYCFDTIQYRIKAIDQNSSYIAYSDTIRLKPFDTVSPVPPVIKYVSVLGTNQVEIAWNRSTSADANMYVIYRKGPKTPYMPLDTLNNKFVYTDVVPTDSIYTYTLIAIDSCIENPSYYKSKGVNTLLLQSRQLGCQDKLELYWNPYNNFDKGLDKYELYRSIDGKAEILIASIPSNSTSFIDNVSPHHKYVYRVKALEIGGTYSGYSQKLSAQVYSTAVPRARTASIIETNATNGSVEITWDSQKGQPFIAHSDLFYREESSPVFTLLRDSIPLVDTFFVHVGLNTKTTNHQYFLVNIDSCGSRSDTLSIHKTMNMDFGYGQLQHNLSWTSYKGFGVNLYILQQLIGGKYINIDTISPTKSQFTRFPAPCNTVITYRMAAVDSVGALAYSDTTSGLAIDLQAPDAPRINNVTVVDNHHIQIDFTGGDSTDTYGYGILKSRNGLPFITDGIVLYTLPQQKSTYLDTVNLAATYFTYRVVALDSCLNANASTSFKPVFVGGSPGNFENHLSWRPFVGYPVQEYRIEHFDGLNWVTIDTAKWTDTVYTHGPVGCNSPVSYRIVALENGGNRRSVSNWVSLTPFDTISPTMPIFHAASVSSHKTLELRWDYQPTSDVKHFIIWKKGLTGTYSPIDTVLRTDRYTDSVASPQDSTYLYYIQAVDSCSSSHVSPPSDTASNFIFTYKRDTCDPTNLLQWSIPLGLSKGIDIYIIHRSTNGRPFRAIDSVQAPITLFIDSTVATGNTYAYKIMAVNTTISQWSETDTQQFVQEIRNLAQAPSIKSVTVMKTDPANGEVALSWGKIDRQKDPFVVGYRLYWIDSLDLNPSLIAEFPKRTDTTYSHTVNTSERRGFYRLTAINTCLVDGDTSLLHSPIQLSVENQNLASQLDWTEYLGFDVAEYRVFSNVEGTGFTQIATLPPHQVSFRDSSVGCGELVAFYVQAVSAIGLLSSSDVEEVVGFDTTRPAATSIITATVNPANELVINWAKSSSSDARYYTIAYKRYSDNIWDTLAQNVQGTSYTDNTLPQPMSMDPWQFRVSVTDSCGNNQPMPSPVHQHIALVASQAGPVVKLNWMNYRGWNVGEFSVMKNGTELHKFKVNKARPDSIFEYLDTNVGCDSIVYQYYIIGKQGDIGIAATSHMDTAIGVDRSSPSSVYLATATVLTYNQGVRLRWEPNTEVDKQNYLVYRSLPGSSDFEAIRKLPATGPSSWVDSTNLDHTAEYCYRIAVEDKCKNEGPMSNPGCALVLTGGNLAMANSVQWAAYQRWPDSVAYYDVYRSYDSLNFKKIGTTDSRFTAYVDTSLNDSFMTYCYRVKAVEKMGAYNEIAWSTTLCITQEPLIYIPTVFSPEVSPGTNDHFGPQGAFIPEKYTMRIFNRWGQIIYETHDGKPWDGRTIDQTFAPVDMYKYQIEMVTVNGVPYVEHGLVRVLR
ncbi:MAG: gliding motility-associated C-terminal domain-containing protein [Bacteroidetes bacterium]|nr:gliding motility-associated C-terminal domain-containing protein [Bacteroidota bacterium]